MLYILTALFCEARPVIERYGLKKIQAPGRIQLFEGDACRLAVGGAGPVCSVTAAAHMLTRFGATGGDFFANVGAAGGALFRVGDIVLCHKIINTFTGRAFYPEMLYAHPFREGVLGSVGKIGQSSGSGLTDMEGAFVYEAAQAFLPSSQIFCIKVVSDAMRPDTVTAESISNLFDAASGDICGWLESFAGFDKPGGDTADDVSALIDVIAGRLRLTFAMEKILRQACRAAKTRGLDVSSILSEYPAIGTGVKADGKAAFAGLLSRLSVEK
jgi:hypothetical protein